MKAIVTAAAPKRARARLTPEMTASAERVLAGGKSIEIARVKITEAGRQALAKS